MDWLPNGGAFDVCFLPTAAPCFAGMRRRGKMLQPHAAKLARSTALERLPMLAQRKACWTCTSRTCSSTLHDRLLVLAETGMCNVHGVSSSPYPHIIFLSFYYDAS
jgi:hypothetical protein